jgi:hypothetical protein
MVKKPRYGSHSLEWIRDNQMERETLEKGEI